MKDYILEEMDKYNADGVDFVPDVFGVCVEKLFCFVALCVGAEL